MANDESLDILRSIRTDLTSVRADLNTINVTMTRLDERVRHLDTSQITTATDVASLREKGEVLRKDLDQLTTTLSVLQKVMTVGGVGGISVGGVLLRILLGGDVATAQIPQPTQPTNQVQIHGP